MEIELELERAWKALRSEPSRSHGLRTFPLVISAVARVQAACAFPGGEEAIWVDVAGVQWPRQLELPRGDGFSVLKLNQGEVIGLVLVRRPAGNPALFALMCVDLVRELERLGEIPGLRRLSWVLDRVRAWQCFMSCGEAATLGPEAERGLIGELIWITSMLEVGVSPRVAVESWRAPDGWVHDFDHPAFGAIEVKSAVAGPGFPVTIGSLEQLDPQFRQPLALVGVRLSRNTQGQTLPESAGGLLARLRSADPDVAHLCGNRLVQRGLLPGTEVSYTNRYQVGEVLLVPVTDPFPSLSSRSVPFPVVSAQYVIDLETLRARAVDASFFLFNHGWVCDGRS